MDSLIALVLGATVFLVPLVVSPSGRDMFRLPKEVVADGGAIVIAALALLGALFGRFKWQRWRENRLLWLVGLTLAWTVITSLTSTNRALSALSLAAAASAAVLILAAHRASETLPVNGALQLLWIPAVVNSLLVIVQRFNIWNPFVEADPVSRLHLTALLGNPNDVGMYLVTPVLTAFEYGLRKRSGVALSVSAVCTAGIATTQTLTAAIALSCGLLVLLIGRFRARTRLLLNAAIAAMIPLAIVMWLRGPLILQWIHEGNYDRILSGRVPAFIAAWHMFVDHPVTGVGPGCFGWQYYAYRLALEKQHPELVSSITQGINFGFVHNDFLEVAAETGIAGLALLSLCLWVFARRRPRAEPASHVSSEAAHLANALRPALAASAAALMLTQFPLQIAATAVTMLYVCGLCMGWSGE